MELTVSKIKHRIYSVREHEVVLDKDLAEFYHTKTKALNQAVMRNLSRFPEDFMFQLTLLENNALPFPLKIKQGETRGGSRTLPYCFTRNGISMLSSVLTSDKAVQINIMIMRAFGQLQEGNEFRKSIINRFDQLEVKFNERFQSLNDQFKTVLDTINSFGTEKSVGVESALAQLISNPEHFKSKVENITIRKESLSKVGSIQDAVAKHFNLQVQDLKRVSRSQTIVIPRQIAIYLIRIETGIGFREIGGFFGSKDHSTILHAFRKVSASLEGDTSIRDVVEAVQKSLGHLRS